MDVLEFRKFLKQHRDKVTKKYGEYLQAEENLTMQSKITQNGLIDKKTIEKVSTKKREWQLAVNAYNDFFLYGLENGLFFNQN